MTEASNDAHLSVHGLTARVHGDWPEVVEALRRDFAWYSAPAGPAGVDVEIVRATPDLDRFGPLVAESVAERYAVYRDGPRLVTDYHGRAVAVADQEARTLVVRGDDGWVVRRAAFDYLLAEVDAHLARIGLPRVHGLGLGGKQGGVLVMMPTASGKTTLALSAIRSEGVGFLSEGSPLLDREGNLWPFPIPLWVRAYGPEAATLPREHVRSLPGIDPDPAVLEIAAFADKIPAGPVPLGHVVLGRRSLGREPRLEELGRRAAIEPFLRETIVGQGFMRGVEYAVRNGPASLARELARAGRRASHCYAGLRRASVWRLTLGLDREANWNALAALLS